MFDATRSMQICGSLGLVSGFPRSYYLTRAKPDLDAKALQRHKQKNIDRATRIQNNIWMNRVDMLNIGGLAAGFVYCCCLLFVVVCLGLVILSIFTFNI